MATAVNYITVSTKNTRALPPHGGRIRGQTANGRKRAAADRERESGSYKNREGKTIYYTNYTTTVEVDLQYHLERARDGSLVGPVIRSARRSATSQEGFPSHGPLIRKAVENALGYIHHQLSPHTVTVRRTFRSDRNPAVKNDMKTANDAVKAGNYKQALNMYLAILQRSPSVAAAENASYLLEAMGDTEGAADLMREAFEATGNPAAQARLAVLEKILADAATLESEFSGQETVGNLRDRAARNAVENIANVLPDGAIVWFYNSASRRNAMIEGIADNITAAFTGRGIRIVERQNVELIASEQKFQMSGMVSDSDIVNIGRASGANVIVIIGMSGEAANRRLTIRVLDVETQSVIMQSDTGEQWQI